MILLKRQLSPICAEIAAGVAFDCDNIPNKGVDATIYIANFNDIASYTFNASTNIASAITMVSGKTFFSFEGSKTSAKPKSIMRKLPFINVHDHEVSSAVFKVDAPTFTVMQDMCGGKFVMIVKNNFIGTAGETEYKIYGKDSGLFMENLVYDPYNADGALLTFTLKSDPDSPESRLPVAFYNTNRATTAAAVAALL